MKNLSVRARILGGLVLFNLVAAVVVVVYLHQSFGPGLTVTADKALSVSTGSWAEITEHLGKPIEAPLLVSDGDALLERVKAITNGQYGLLIDKSAISQAEYAKARAGAKKQNNWSEGDTYVLAAITDEALSGKMLFTGTPDSVPEAGKQVGIENGACTQTCHGNLKRKGDYWGVEWSNDGKSRVHVVFPITTSGGRPIGLLYSIDDITPQVDSNEATLFRTLYVILGMLFVATLGIGWMLDVLVLRRLQKMTHAIQDLSIRVAGGDFDAKFEPDGTTDEIGAFEQFFSNFVDVMTSTIKSLTQK